MSAHGSTARVARTGSGRRRTRSSVVVLTAAALSGGLLAQASPAGAVVPGANGRLACEGDTGSSSDVFTMDPDGSDVQFVTDSPARDGDPSWAPDGTTLAFESLRDGGSEVWTIAADGSRPTRLTSNGPAEDRGTSWSPDGRRIAYHSGQSSPGAGPSGLEIMTMNADGSDQRRLTDNDHQDSQPSWSPDGSRIAFTSFRDGDYEIYVMGADGTGPTRLTTSPGEDAHAAWSPDGSQIAFHTRRFGALDVMVMNADGTSPRLVTTDPGSTFEFFPAWSPDGTQISYTGNTHAPSNFDVYVVDADGTDTTRLTTAPGFDGRCDWSRLLPTDASECRDRGWQRFNSAGHQQFRNQGECVAHVRSNRPSRR